MKDMKSYLQRMQQEGIKLGEIDGNEHAGGNPEQLASLCRRWQRLDRPLTKTRRRRPARRHPCRHRFAVGTGKSVENFFNGAMDGVRGMGDLGLSIDPHTNMASSQACCWLDTLMSSNKKGVSNAIRSSAPTLPNRRNCSIHGNFIPNRLSILTNVIDYIDRNKTSLQAEFGLGDPAKPNALVAKALAAYNTTYGSAA